MLMSIILAAFAVLWIVTPAKSIMAGLLLGGAVSFYNILHIARKLQIAGDRAITGSGKRAGVGMTNRFLMPFLPIILAIRYPEWINILSIFLGLPIGYLVAVVVEFKCLKEEEKINRLSSGKG